jgi:hypothetical protein
MSYPPVIEANNPEQFSYIQWTLELSYDRLDIRTTWVTTKILDLTYDQSLELRPECRSRPLELRPARRL